jgi:hypothetical protein
MATVLITQCLQRDFADPIGPHDPLPACCTPATAKPFAAATGSHEGDRQ